MTIALASLGFAAFSWWMADGAKKARDQAQEDRRRVERQVQAVEEIAASLARPPLSAHHLGDRDRTIVVRNTSSQEITLKELLNESDFHMFGSMTRDREGVWPVTIPVGSLHRFYALMNHGYAMPDHFEFRVEGSDSPIFVGLEPAAEPKKR
ncbi:hypothetical protein BCL67_109102 [Nesterenkonia sandarakina]|uniref:Uncharacterized protein n=1 Tax=Nesterenkonia sandarakina TaxID=272918 RepID=A0A2T0YJ05_9MICC|nr:hypothetical protein BCL67_109102 [Nesterenkonia sandarakina]